MAAEPTQACQHRHRCDAKRIKKQKVEIKLQTQELHTLGDVNNNDAARAPVQVQNATPLPEKASLAPFELADPL
jgi:hypothetical protein